MATDIEKLVISMSADIRSMEREMKRGTGVFDREANAIERRHKQLQAKLKTNIEGFGKSLVAPLGGLGAGIGAMLSVHEVVEYAESWHKIENRLRVAGYAGAELESVLEKVYQASQRSTQKTGAFAEVFQQFSEARAGVGATTDELIKFTEALGLAGKIDGRSITDLQGVITPLLVAFQSGKFNAKGIRGMFAETPELAQAAAKGLDAAGGSVKRLFALVSENKVTPTQFFQAVLKGFDEIEATAKKKEATVGGAMTNLDNAMGRYVGAASASLGASSTLAGGINFLADHIEEVVKWTEVLAGAVGPMGLALAARGATAAMGALVAAVAANPLMAAVIVISALATAIVVFSDKVVSATTAVNKERDAHAELNKLLAEAKKNHNTVAQDKADEAKAHLLAAQAVLKEAEAQAQLNMQRAQAMTKAPATMTSNGNFIMGWNPETISHQYQDDLNRIHAAQRENESDLKKLGTVKTTPVVVPMDAGTGGADAKVQALAERRKATLASTATDLEQSRAELVRALSEAHEQMLRGTDDYYTAVRQKVDDDANAQIAAIVAKRDQELSALEKMKKGWSEYSQAKANIEQGAQNKIDAVNAKRGGDLSSPISDLAEQTKQLRDSTAAMGLTDDAADRLRTTERGLAIAAALAAGGHEDLAQKMRDAVAAYDQASKEHEATAEKMRKNTEEADAFRDALENVGTAGLKGFKSFKDALAQSAEELAAMIWRLEVMEPLIESIFGKKGTPLSFGRIGGSNERSGSSDGGAAGGIFSDLWQGAMNLLGFASGGPVHGPGGPRSDGVLARLSNGEFVVNSDAARRHRGLLEALNGGLRGFALGGMVPSTGECGPEFVLRGECQ